MYNQIEKTIDGQLFTSSYWTCDKCMKQLEFNQMISIKVQDFTKSISTEKRLDLHKDCIGDLKIVDLLCL